LEGILNGFEPALIHAHCWYRELEYGVLADLAARWPVVLTIHDVFPINQYGTECWECYRNPYCLGCPALEPIRRWRPNYRVRDRWSKRRANRRTRCHLIYPSLWMERRFARSEWAGHGSSVIPYGIDTERFAPGDPERGRFGLPEGPLILFAGNMYSPADHRKGLPDLVDAFAAVRARLPDAHLVIAGRVTGFGSEQGAMVLGNVPREDLAALYRSADVFCIPSHGDNLPVAVLEAMASGLAVVGTTVGGIPEQVEDGVTGLLVPRFDPASLAAALLRVLTDREERKTFATAGRERALRLFSREMSAARHEALYRTLALNARPRLRGSG
jgi:glycosyltransferase involved in cell wall biosynthesis